MLEEVIAWKGRRGRWCGSEEFSVTLQDTYACATALVSLARFWDMHHNAQEVS